MSRLPSIVTVCVFTCAALLASLLAITVGGFDGGTTVSAELAGAQIGRHEPGTTRASSAPATDGAARVPESATPGRVTATTTRSAATSTTASMPGMAMTPGMTMAPAPVTDPVPASPSMAGTKPSTANPPNRQYHEFQVNCTITDHRADDPIVFPGRAGASHNHTFFGNDTTDADSTLGSLLAGGTSCKVPADLTAYWMPTLYNGTTVIDPTETITYYKSDVKDYTSVRPFPKGLRFLAGSPTSTRAEFTHGYWSCGNSGRVSDIPASCPPGSKLIARYVAPSCWDGVHLDVPDHKSHLAYPVAGRCTATHPVALPMLEFKIPYPVSGNMSQVRLSSGRGFTFHYDFYNAWDDATQAALVKTCINGGMQCNARGYDQHYPDVPAALGADYTLRR